MKNIDKGRIEIRLPASDKEAFYDYAKEHNTTMSRLIYEFIISKIDKEKNYGKTN